MWNFMGGSNMLNADTTSCEMLVLAESQIQPNCINKDLKIKNFLEGDLHCPYAPPQ